MDVGSAQLGLLLVQELMTLMEELASHLIQEPACQEAPYLVASYLEAFHLVAFLPEASIQQPWQP